MTEELKILISAEIGKLKQELDKGKKEVENFSKNSKTSFKDFTDAATEVGNSCKQGLKVAATAVAGAATALLALGASTKEYRENQGKLNAAFEAAGASASTTKQVYNDLFRVLGEDDRSVEAANHLAKMTTNQKELSQWTNICQGIFATFGDSLPIEGLTEAANETAKVGAVTGPLADALNWAGISEDKFNEKLAACATEQEREQLIRETLNKTYDTASKNYEKNAASVLKQNEAQAKLNEEMAKLGEAMAPIQASLATFATEVLAEITPYIQSFAEEHGPALKETLGQIAEAIGKVIGFIADNWELVSTLAIVIGTITVALSIFSTVMGIVNAVMLASPVTWIVLAIVAAIALLVAIIVVVINHWDEIKAVTLKVWEAIKNAVSKAIEFVKKVITTVFEAIKIYVTTVLNIYYTIFTTIWNAIKTVVTGVVNGVKDTVINVFTAVKNTVSTIVNGIKSAISSAFNGIKSVATSVWNGIKNAIVTPIQKARDLVKGVIDKIKGFFSFKITWPKIPTPSFGIKPSGWKIGDLLKGEIPKLSIKWNAVGGVFDRPTIVPYGNTLQGLGEAGAEAIVPLEKNTEWLDKIADKLSAKQGKTPVVLNVDGKTFAQTTINTVNELTRQTGSLKLNIL